MIQFKVRSFYDVHDDVFDDCVQTEITTTATQVLPRHVRKIDHDGNYVILKSEQSDMICDITYPHTHALVNGDILTPDEYDEKISIEDFVISLENATSENELIQLLEAKDKSFLLDAESKCIHVSLYSTPINRKQSKKYIVKKIAEYILDWQKALNEARNPQENITLNAEVRDISERKALNETTEVKALPATASQQEDKNDCHKFCVGDFFTFLDEYYTVIKRTPCYVFLQDKNYRTIRADVGIYDRDHSTLNVCKGEEYIIFKISGHEYKIDAKDKEEKPAELIRQEQKLKPEPIKKRSPEEAQNLPKYVYEITPKGHYVIMDNEVLSKGLSNRREWQIPHLAPFKYGDVIHPEKYEISIKISNIALQLENAKDEKTVREILKKYDKSFIRDIACNAYHFAFDEYERHSVFSFKTTKKDLLALLIKTVLKVNEAMRDAQSKSQFFYIGDRTCYAHDSNQDNKPQEISQNVQQETKSDIQQELKCCIFCGSKKKPYIRTRKGNNYKTFRSGFWASGTQSWFTVRIKCRFCGKEIECSGDTKEEAMQKAIAKWNCEHIKTDDKPIVEHAQKQTRMPRKRIQVTTETISSCQNENDAVTLLLTLKKEEILNIAKELRICVQFSKRVMSRDFNTKEKISRHIAHQLYLRRKIQTKKTSNHDEATMTNKLENFSYSTNKKTGQISFIFE